MARDTSDPTLSLQVVDLDGEPIPSAAVTVQGKQGWTDDSGWVSFAGVAPGRVAAWVVADGFVSATTARSVTTADVSVTVKLLSRGAPISFDAGAGAVIESGIVRVSIPPKALVDQSGAGVSGSVNATVVSIDPTVVPQDAYPAPLAGRRADDKHIGTLISFGMAEVRLTQGDQEVQLAPGAAAKLEITIPSSLVDKITLGETIPQWTVSPDGLWDETGSGMVTAGVGGNPTWTTPLGFVNVGKNCDVWVDQPPPNP